MCKFASFFHNPLTGDIAVSVLDSHGETEKKLSLSPKIWREGHYLPTGEIDLRLAEDDRVDRAEYEESFRVRFPTFKSFLIWALGEIGGTIGGSLYVSGCDLKGVTLPKAIKIFYYQNKEQNGLSKSLLSHWQPHS